MSNRRNNKDFVKVIIEVPNKIHKKIKQVKLDNNLTTQGDAILLMVEDYKS